MLDEPCTESDNGSTSLPVQLIVIIVLAVVLLIAIIIAIFCFVKVYLAKKKVASPQEETQLRSASA